MKKIPLTQGKFALVDDADFELVNQWKWTFHSMGYAYRMVRLGNKKQKSIFMHRFLLSPPQGLDVDHVNLDKLDNRRENIRLCSRRENLRNKSKIHGKSSKFKGVSWKKRHKKWCSSIRGSDGKQRHLGYFDVEKEAADAYDRAAMIEHGVFARLNGDS